MRRKKKPVSNSQMITDIKNQLKRTMDPIERELLNQKLHHYQIQARKTQD